MQKESFQTQLSKVSVGGFIAIFYITDYRVTDIGRMDTDLVGSARFDPYFHQAAIFKYFEWFEMADCIIAGFIGLHHMLATALHLADADINRFNAVLPLPMEKRQIGFLDMNCFFLA